MLRLAGQLVVVVGAGAVGSRKATAALVAGATGQVVDPALANPDPEGGGVFPHTVDDARGSPELLPEPYHSYLDGGRLVFACATPGVDARVVADAHARGIWANSATEPAVGDLALPSVIRVGDLSFAVSTGGAPPALTRRVREKLEAEFDAAFAEWVRVLAEVGDVARRRELLDAFADWPWLARLRRGGALAVRDAMQAEIEERRQT